MRLLALSRKPQTLNPNWAVFEWNLMLGSHEDLKTLPTEALNPKSCLPKEHLRTRSPQFRRPCKTSSLRSLSHWAPDTG